MGFKQNLKFSSKRIKKRIWNIHQQTSAVAAEKKIKTEKKIKRTEKIRYLILLCYESPHKIGRTSSPEILSFPLMSGMHSPAS